MSTKNTHLELIDDIILQYINELGSQVGAPTDDQIKILLKAREIYSGQNKRRLDVRLQTMNNADLEKIFNDDPASPAIQALLT